jgi:hypothetical protein
MEYVEYQGYEICVRTGYVVIGEDPMAEPIDGFTCDIRVPDAVQEDPDGDIVYDFPFDHAKTLFQAATEDEVVAQAKAYIDEHGKRSA